MDVNKYMYISTGVNSVRKEKMTREMVNISELNMEDLALSPEAQRRADKRSLERALSEKQRLSRQLTPKQLYQRRMKEGEIRDVSHIFRVNGNVVGLYSGDGFITRNGLVGGAYTGDPHSMTNVVQVFYAKYGRANASVETYSKGNGPTRAEVMTEFNGRDYYQMMREIYKGQSSYAAEQSFNYDPLLDIST